MADCDPSLIVRLVPLNERTRNAWKDPHNAPFYVPASFQGFQRREGSSRETTPYEADIATQNKVSDEESEIRLTLNDIPKDVTQGFMFGRSKSSCDVYCGERSDAYNISGQAFSITINKKGQVILKYLTPKSNISVQYGDQEPGVRTTFTWILFPECKKGIVIKVAEELVFGVIMPLHGDFAEEYRKGCYEYVANVESAVASIPVLGVESQSLTTDPSRIPTPNTKPFYYRCVEEELGRGSFGKVYLVRDVTTGKKYAGKEFHCDQVDQNEGHILAQQNHANIVKYVDFTLEGGALLVMEYARGGNLARPWRVKDQVDWNVTEIAMILYQCLHALAYLHAEPTVIHRDIKPQNILVEHRYRTPFVKIGDFGFAKEGSKVGGKSGTWTYTAPEVFSNGLYNPTVDIWSLGVVVMQMLLKGHLHKPKDGIPHGAAWCNNIERCAAQNYIAREQHDRKSLRPSESSRVTELWSFLMTCMLRVDAHKRFSAKKCLEVGNSTVFKFVQKTKGEGQRIPTGRQHGGSSLGPTASESKGRISTADVETSDSEETANEQDQPIHPIVAVRDVMNPKTYNSAASGVAYDQGVNEAEVWKDQGSKADGTVKPTIEGATDEPASLTSEDLEYLERMLPIKKANGEGNRDSSGVSPHSTATNNPYQPAVLPNASTSAANNAQQPAVLPNTPISTANIAPGQTLDFASMEMAKNNYEEILMAWLRS